MNAHVPVTQMHSLADHAVLAHLSISQWTGRKFDRPASDGVNAAHNSADAARVHKRLLAKKALASISATVASARADHDRLTLPWGVRGLNILAVAGYLEYRAAMDGHALKFSQAVADFERAYPQLREDAKAELGSLYNEGDYPEPGSVSSRFAFDVRIMPVPSRSDFRVNLHDSHLDEVREDMERRTKEAASEAIRTIYERAAECVSDMAEKLAAFDPAQIHKGRFRDSLISNVREMAATLPRLNVFADPAIDALGAKLAALASCEAQDLRDSDTLRSDTIAQAQAMAADLSATVSDYF